MGRYNIESTVVFTQDTVFAPAVYKAFLISYIRHCYLVFNQKSFEFFLSILPRFYSYNKPIFK